MTSETDKYSFVGQVDDVKSVISLLKAVNFKEIATCVLTERGVKVTVEDSKCVQMSAFLQAELFQDFHVREEEIRFQLSLSVLIECLNIFGGVSTNLKMYYISHGHPLTLVLEEEGAVTDCNIKTLEPDIPVEYNFSTEVNKIIMQSIPLREIFNDLDSTTDLITISFSSDTSQFALRTNGDAGETQTIIPKDSDIVETFDCSLNTSYRYKFTHIKVTFKALAISEKTSVQIDNEGLLCLQYVISTDIVPCYIEYYCIPQIPDDHSPSQATRRCSVSENEEVGSEEDEIQD